MSSSKKTTTLKTLRKWESEFSIKLEFDTKSESKIYRIKCSDCKKWETRINSMKNFSESWIIGAENVSKDAVEKHFKSEPHVRVIKLPKQENLGEENFREEVVMNSQIAKSFLRLNPADKSSLRVKFNTTYYVIKKERPFTDYPDLLKLQAKNGIENFVSSYGNADASAYFGDYIGKALREDLKNLISKSNYYSVLSDGSTDSSVTEQETIYILLFVEAFLFSNISALKVQRLPIQLV